MRTEVRKTYKLYVGGAFVRSESGRTYEATAHDGTFLANMARATRKDARDAVVAARGAQPGWAGRTAYNRAQILYRVAEVLEGRAEQFAAEVAAAEGVDRDDAVAQVGAAVDRWVWYAGWADKIDQVFGNGNPVAGPYFNLSTTEATGVVAVIAPQASSLLGLTSVLAPPLVSGNTVVLAASEQRPVPSVTLAEVLATSDVPAGVANILTGRPVELGTVLAGHRDVNALDLAGIEQPADREALCVLAADSTKRLIGIEEDLDDSLSARSTDGGEPWQYPPTTARLRGALELKTVWHPKGT